MNIKKINTLSDNISAIKFEVEKTLKNKVFCVECSFYNFFIKGEKDEIFDDIPHFLSGSNCSHISNCKVTFNNMEYFLDTIEVPESINCKNNCKNYRMKERRDNEI